MLVIIWPISQNKTKNQPDLIFAHALLMPNLSKQHQHITQPLLWLKRKRIRQVGPYNWNFWLRYGQAHVRTKMKNQQSATLIITMTPLSDKLTQTMPTHLVPTLLVKEEEKNESRVFQLKLLAEILPITCKNKNETFNNQPHSILSQHLPRPNLLTQFQHIAHLLLWSKRERKM